MGGVDNRSVWLQWEDGKTAGIYTLVVTYGLIATMVLMLIGIYCIIFGTALYEKGEKQYSIMVGLSRPPVAPPQGV